MNHEHYCTCNAPCLPEVVDLADLSFNEPDLPAAGNLENILRDAEYHAARRVVDIAAFRALGRYMDRAAADELSSCAIPYQSTRAALSRFIAEHATDAHVIAVCAASWVLTWLLQEVRIEARAAA